MDVLKRFDRLRPDDEYLDDATRDRVWSQISGAESGNADSDTSTRDVLEEEPGHQAPLVEIHPTGQPQRHRPIAVIALVLLLFKKTSMALSISLSVCTGIFISA